MPRKSMKPGGGGRFAKCVKSVSKRKDVKDAKAICAAQGRKKYGAKKMAQWAAKGRERAAKAAKAKRTVKRRKR